MANVAAVAVLHLGKQTKDVTVRNECLDKIYNEVDARLLHAVNGRLPEIVKAEISQVCNDLNLVILPAAGNISSANVDEFSRMVSAWAASSEGGAVHGYQILHQLQALGWVILPPQ